MKDEYVLYLDESEFKASKTFAIAGIAVKKENIDMLEMGVNEIKNLFGMISTFQKIILFSIVRNYRRYLQKEK